MIYTVSFDVEVEHRDQLHGGWFEIHDPRVTGTPSYRVLIGGTQEQRDKAPRILARRVRRKRQASNAESERQT